ncbi:hypothetical protein FIV34_06680 [Luteibacter pinisoli]|uniref:Lipoprotein n=1 Tax=Luteibacter pinisoli TaxID=2589080 RepID=A0A4Y5Z201_9GAMM|nr:hypothetical protein [Luteibacter pinisoli]QDE38906.1 hypothetical protein FIV34_06680 [Luteibacter pinisoli]
MNLPTRKLPLTTTRVALLFALCSCAALSACGSRDSTPQITSTPNPRQVNVDIAIKDAPGPFDSMAATAYYDVGNIDCAPTRPISGAQLGPRERLSVELRQTGPHQYEATMPIDPFVDQDYYGLGVCHWRVVALTVKGTRLKRTFSAMLPGDELLGSGSFATYFQKQSYLDAATPMDVPGVHNLNRFASPDDAFSIDISAREARK